MKYEFITGEHPFGDAGQILLFILFSLIWVIDSFIYKYSVKIFNFIPLYIRFPFVLVLFLLSLYFVVRSHLILLNVKDKIIIDYDIYRFLRHPMYSGIMLFYLSLIFLTLSLFSAIFFIVIFVFYNYIAEYEEKLLVEKAKEVYQKYQQKTRRWFLF